MVLDGGRTDGLALITRRIDGLGLGSDGLGLGSDGLGLAVCMDDGLGLDAGWNRGLWLDII